MRPPTVVLVLSQKRSGSTMLQNALCRHSKIRTVDYSPHTYLETHHWLKGAVMLNPEKEVYPGYGSAKNARTYMLDLLRKNLPNFHFDGQSVKHTGYSSAGNSFFCLESDTVSWCQSHFDSTMASDCSLIFNGWEALCQQFAHPVFFEKSPQYLGHEASLELIAHWIRQTEFRVRIIGLTRNPLSVQYSAWRLFHTPPQKRQYSWARAQRNLLNFASGLSANQYLAVKYEELIKNPEAGFREICNFIGVPCEASIVSELHRKSLSKWREDPYFTLRLDEDVKIVAREFGYTEDELNNPEKPEPHLCWKLCRRLVAIYKLGRARFRDRVLKPLMLRA